MQFSPSIRRWRSRRPATNSARVSRTTPFVCMTSTASQPGAACAPCRRDATQFQRSLIADGPRRPRFVMEGHPRTPWCLRYDPTRPGLLASGCLAGEVCSSPSGTLAHASPCNPDTPVGHAYRRVPGDGHAGRERRAQRAAGSPPLVAGGFAEHRPRRGTHRVARVLPARAQQLGGVAAFMHAFVLSRPIDDRTPTDARSSPCATGCFFWTSTQRFATPATRRAC
jgi:hypothetical protein